MTVRLSRLLCAAAFCASIVSAAHADPVVSNLGDGDGYVSNGAWIVAGPDATFYNAMGMGFTASGNYDVNEIDAWFSANDSTQQITLTLWTDVDGHFGTQLGNWSGLTPNIVGFGNTGAPVAITGISGITLTAGSQYWLEASTEGSNVAYWDWTSSQTTGPSRYVDAVYGDYATIDSRQGAFAIQGTIAAADTGSVPEPASWALMLGGFGMVGGALRSRRKAAVTFA